MNAAKSRIIALTVLVLSLTMGLPCAHAATTNWLGTTSADWNLAGNWDNGVPTAGNDAVFPAVIPGTGATITVAAGMAANSITFNGTYTLTGGDITLTAGNNLNAAATKVGTISSVLAGTTVGINGINTVNLALTTGTVVLGGANTYNGATSIAAGIASVTNASGLGTGTVTVTVASGAELEVNAAITIANKNASMNGTGVGGSAFTVKNNVTWSGTFTAATATTVSVDTGFALTLGNTVPLTATGLLTKTGTGNVAFSAGVSTGAAGVSINAGVIIVNGASRIDSGNIIVNSGGTLRTIGGGTDSIGGGRTITVNTGGILDWQQTGAETFAGLTLNGVGAGAGAMINAGNTAGGTITAAVTIGSNTTINTGTGSLSLASAISGATFSLTKIGTGTLVVSNANTCAALNIFAGTYSGRAIVGLNPYGTGTITLGDSANVAVAANLQIQSNITTSYPNPIVTGTNMNAGTLTISDPSGANITFGGAITLNNSNLAINNSNGQANSFLNFTGGVTGTGNLTLNGSAAGSPITFSTGVIDMVGTITDASTNAGGLVTINSAIGTNVTGIIQNSANAPMLLAGNNTYAGAVTVSAGTLDVANGGTVQGPVNVTTANLSGRGTINGAVALAGTNPTLTPGDFNNNGNGNNANGIGTLTIANNVTFSAPGTQTYQLGASGINDKLVTTGTGNVTFGASGTVTLVATNGFDPSATYTLVDTSAGTGTISGAATLVISMPGYTFATNKATATNTLTVGPFTPTGAATQLTWVGGGSANLNLAANWSPAKLPTDPTGPFELVFTGTNPGTLTNTMANGTPVLALTFTGGTYNLTGNSLTILSSASSATSPVGTGIGVANGVTATVATAVNLGNLSSDFSVGTGSALTVSGVVSSSGLSGVNLSKSGTGTLTLSVANTLLGGVTLNAGTLNINQANALGATGTALVAGTFTLNGGTINNTTAGGITVANPYVLNADLIFTGTNALTFSSAATLNSTRTLTSNGSTLTLSGILSGTGFGLTKNGAGALTLSAANTFTGPVTINAGTVTLGNATGLGSAASAQLSFGPASTGILALNGNNVTLTSVNTDAITPGTPIIRNGHATTAATLTVNNTAPCTFAGTFQNGAAAALNLAKNGASSFTLLGASSYSGTTAVLKGTLVTGVAAALPSTTAVTVTADTVAGVDTVLDFAGFGGTIASLVTVCENAGNTLVSNVGDLTISGSLILGRHATASTNTNTATMTVAAGKVLNVGSGPAAAMTLGEYSGADAASGQVTTLLDASNASGVNFNVGSLIFGNGTRGGGALNFPATLLLPTSPASNCAITASTTLQMGKTGGPGMPFTHNLVFGGGTNVVTTPTFLVGGNKVLAANVSIVSGGTLTLAGTMSLQIADQSTAGATGTISTCTFDMSGGTLIAGALSNVVVGKLQGASTAGGAQGTLNFGTSASTSVSINSLTAGQETTATQTGPSSTQGTVILGNGSVTVGSVNLGSSFGASSVPINGTLTINGGAMTVTGGMTLATGTGAITNPTTGIVNLNGGTLTVSGNIAKGGGTGLLSAIFNFNAGTLRAGANNATFMTGLNAANINNTVTIDTNGFDIAIGQALLGTGTGAITKIGAGTLALNGINTYTGATSVTAGMLGGTGTIAGPVNFDPNAALAPGSFGIGTLALNSGVVFNGSNFTYDLGLPGALGGTFNDLATPTAGTPSMDFGATAGTLTIIRQNGFNVGTYTLISGYTLSNTANLPTVTPIAGVTMNTSVVGNTLLLNVTSVTNTPTGALATWTGTAADHNWSNPANWGGTDIAVGGPYELIFPASATDFISNNDIVAGITIRSILITSGTAYTIGNNGGGAVTINGTGTYSGTPITVLAGSHSIATTPLVWTANSVIYVGAGGLGLTSNITSSTFTTFFNTAVNMNYDGILGAGTGGIVKLGAGTLTLNGVNSFTGNNTINEGTLSISQTGNLGQGVAANTILFPAGGSGTLQLTTTQSSSVKGILLSGNGIIDIPNAGDTWTLSGTSVFSGTRGYTKTGAGTLILSQANTLTGPVTLNAGTLQLGNATGLGPAASAQLNFGPDSTGVLALNGTNATVVGLNTDPLTPGTPIIRNGSGATNCTLTVNNTTVPSTFSGTIQNGGIATLAITKNGAAGTLLLSGNNTQTGNPTLTAGTLKLGSATALGAATVTLTTTAGTLDLNGNNLTVANFTGNAANTITDTAAGAGTSILTITGLVNAIANLILDGPSRVVAIEVGNNNTNTAILSNPGSTFSGGLTLLTTAGGTRLGLATATAANLGAGTAGAIVSGPFGRGPIIIGKLATDKAGIFISAANVTIFNDIVFNTTLGTDRLGIRVDGIGCAIEGRVMCNNSNALISTNGTGVMTIGGQITSIGAGATGLVLGDTANGTSLNVILSNTTNPANDYTGDTVIQNRATTTLTLGANDQIPDGAGKGNLSVGGAGSNFNLAGFSETVNGLSGAGNIDGLSGTALLTVGNNDQSSTFGGVLRNTAGTLALTKVGTGMLILTGTNTLSGTTTISTGTLQIGNNGTTGTLGAGTVVNNGALVYNRSNALNITNNISGTGTLTLNGGAATVYTISGNNSYDGLTTSNVPQIIATSDTAFGSAAQGVVISIGTVAAGFGSRLDLSNVNIAAEPLTLPSNLTGDLRSSLTCTTGTSSWGGLITLTGTGTIQVRGEPGILNVSGNIGDAAYTGTLLLRGTSPTTCSMTGDINIPAGKVTKTDANTWTVGAVAKTYNWTTTQVSVGTLALSAANVLPPATVVTMGQNDTANATLNLSGFDQTVGGLALSSTGGTKSITSATSANFTVDTATTQTFDGLFTGAVHLRKAGAGQLSIGGVNTHSGGDSISAGILRITNVGALGTGGLTLTGGSLNLNSLSPTVTSLSGTGGSISDAGAAAGTTTLIVNQATDTAFAGTIQDGAPRLLALTKTGVGTLTLASSNTYSGATAINAGTLLVTNTSGSATGSGTVTVDAVGTLGGTGSVNGPVNVNGSVAPGIGSVGTLSVVGNITFNSGSSLIVDLVGATGDQLAAGGSVTLGANVTLNATATTPTHGNTFAIISKSGAATITGTFNTLVENTPFLISGRPFLIHYAGGDGNDVVLVDNDVPVFTAAGTNTSQPLDEVEPLAALLATDPDGDALTFTLFSGTLPAAVTLNTDGTFSGVPSFGTAGVYSAVIQATDTRGAFVRTTLSITVNAVRATINNLTIAEFAGTATLTVTRSGLGHQTVTVQAITANGTALAGSDYTSTSVLVTIPAGQLTQTVSIPILDDTIAEPSEFFTVGISAPTNALIGTEGTGQVTLIDDESTPTLSVSTVSVSEAAGTVQITVSLVGASSQSISVNYGTSNVVALSGIDYIGTSGTLTWLPAELGSKTFTVQILEDALDENNESFNVNLTNVTSSAALGQASASVVILDNDLPPVAVNDSVITGQNVPTNITVLTNDTGLGNTPVAVSVFFGPAHGTVTVNADNTFTYTSESTFAGFDSFIYRVTDAVGQSSNATVLIDVRAGPTFTSTPTLSPNPALAGQTILGSTAFVNGTITWNWGDGSPLETTANVSHVYQVAGIYTVVTTLTSPEGVQSAIQTQIFIGLGFGDGTGGGGGGGANPPGVNGILVGAGGAGKLQGGSGKLAVSYVRRDKTTFSGSLGQLSLPATLTQTALTGLSSKLTIGTGVTAAQFPFALGKTGKAKAPGLTSFELSVKKKRIRFSARREDLTAIMESLGAAQQNPVDKKKVISLLIPVTAQIGDKIYLAMTFAIKFKQTNTSSGKGGL